MLILPQERKDHLLGRVFGHKALIQSSILFTSGADPECWTSVLDYIFTLAHNVPWLRDECGVVLCDAIRQLSGHANSLKEIDSVIQRLCSANLAKTPEGVAIWLTAMAVAPDLTFPKNIWRKEDPLCVKERTSLAKIMKEDYAKSTENGEPKIKSGSSQPKLKEAWDIVLASAIQKCESKARKGSDKADFGKFWKEVVDSKSFYSSFRYALSHLQQIVYFPLRPPMRENHGDFSSFRKPSKYVLCGIWKKSAARTS